MKETKHTVMDSGASPADHQGISRMDAPRTLRLHPLIVLVIVLLLLLSLLFVRTCYVFPEQWGGPGFPRNGFRPEKVVEFVRTYTPVGLLYGWMAIVCWLTTMVNRTQIRVFVISTAVISVGLLLGTVSTRVIPDALASTVMFVLVLSIGMDWFKIPRFRNPVTERFKQDRAGKSIQRQFSIGDLFLITTVLAMMFLLIQRTTLVVGLSPAEYWVYCFLIALINASSVLMVFRMAEPEIRKTTRLLRWGVSGLLIVGSLLFSAMNESWLPKPVYELRYSAFAYGSILIPMWGLVTLMSWMVGMMQPPASSNDSDQTLQPTNQ